MSWALYEVPDLKPTTRLVLAILADHSGHDGTGAYPSAQTVAEAVGIDRRNVMTHIKQLENLGLIKRGDQRHVQHIAKQFRPVVYDLCMAPAERVAGIMKQAKVGVMPPSHQPHSGMTPASHPDVMKTESRCDASGDASITQTNKPKEKPTQAHTHETRRCSGCGRERSEDQMTGTGICFDCLPEPVGANPEMGSGLALFRATREALRAKKPALTGTGAAS